MIDVAGNHHYLAHQPADSDASLCLPPSYISGDYFVNPATGCFTPRSDSPASTTYEMSFFSHDTRSRPLPVQRYLSKPAGAGHSHSCDALPSTVIMDADARILHLCPCETAKPAASSPDGDKGPPEDKAKKRQAQNRAAQRAFRQRKERKVKDLEERAAELEKTTKETMLENQRRRHRIRDLFIENQVLRAALATDGHARGRSGPVPPRLDAVKGEVSPEGEETFRFGADDAQGAGYLPWWNNYRLMLSEDKIVGQLQKLESANDDLL
ncbi:bZIP transcription factor, bZIP-1 [Metarhizium brunneum]